LGHLGTYPLVAIIRIVPASPSLGQLPHHTGLLRLARFRALAETRPADWQFSDANNQWSLRPAGNLALNSMEACVEAAAMSLGVTQVWSSVAHNAVQARRLVPLLTAFTSQRPGLYFSYPAQRQASARLRAFSDFLVEVFSLISAQDSWQPP
jgi:DNA-binding transcriptional LysR family regulator